MRLSYLSLIIPVLLLSPLVSAQDESSASSVDFLSRRHGEGETTTMSNMHAMNSSNIIPSPAKLHDKHAHGMPVLNMTNLEPQQRLFWEQYDSTSYWTVTGDRKAMLYLHAFGLFMSVSALYPISVMLSITKSPFYIPILTLNLAVMLFSLIALFIYEPSTPAYMYPNNAYTKMSIILFFLTIVHYFAAIIKSLSEWAISAGARKPLDGADYMLANLDPLTGERTRLSIDSGHAMSPISSNFMSSMPYTDRHSLEDDADDIILDDDYSETNLSTSNEANQEDNKDAELEPIIGQAFETKYQNQLMAKLMANAWVNHTVRSLGYVSTLIFSVLNRPLFVYHMIYFFTGITWSFRLGMGGQVFNVLAHFIKGGVFFAFGLLTWARFIGAWANKGWAWNLNPEDESLDENDGNGNGNEGSKVKMNKGTIKHRFHNSKSSSPGFFSRLASKILPANITMEFIECFLIFFYGSTNIFMEHMANPNGAWSAKDLQHASIAFMFLGGGLAGLLCESQVVSSLLSTKKHPMSFNPFGAFVIFWTGILMSQHEQEIPTSTIIHSQWGNLLATGAVFRLFTYTLLYLKPPTDSQPTRPFTEAITSFCLIAGGLVFIQSNNETVLGMVYRGINGMFTLNVTVGITALIMSWEFIVFAIKGWSERN